MPPRLALVFCVHHKPWLMMSTVITALAQDVRDVDLHVLYNVGGGDARYGDAPAMNPQLSAWDERVRGVCRLKRRNVFEVEYTNDEALDSGAWLKFVRDGRWTPYDWVLFGGEGTLFARSDVLSAAMTLAASNPSVHVIASGHEKRRLPKDRFLNHDSRGTQPPERDRQHSAMIRRAFEIFCRDPEFARVYARWTSDFQPETQNHVPVEGPPSSRLRRLQSAWVRRFGPLGDGGWLRELPWSTECLVARWRVGRHHARSTCARPWVHVNGVPRPLETVAAVERVGSVHFHRVEAPEWFACTGPHLMSRRFLERLSSKFDEFGLWDVLDLRFSGTPLEVLWGLMPAWLGFEKWFTDGFHRVRKDFVTYRREDGPAEMATYINRYYRGLLAVAWRSDYLKVRGAHRDLAQLWDELPPIYF